MTATAVKAERMVIKLTDRGGEPKNDVIVSLNALPDDTYELKKIVYWQLDFETGKEGWVVVPVGFNPTYEEALKDELTAEIKRIRATDEPINPEYQEILSKTRRKVKMQDNY